VPHLTAQENKATAVYLLAWAIFTTYMCVAAMRTNGAVLAVFVALAITYILLTIGGFANKTDITRAGGWAGLVTAAFAWYASFAAVTNATWGRIIMPTIPLAPGAVRTRGTLRRHAATPAGTNTPLPQ